MKFQTIKVTSVDDGVRLDRWFKRNYPNITFGSIAKLTRKKDILLNGKRVDVSDKVHDGDEVKFPEFLLNVEASQSVPDKPRHSNEIKRQVQEMVIFEDKNIIVLNKPAGFAVQGGSKIKHSIDDYAQFLVGEDEGRPKLVHRLDKETSGILILAKRADVAAKLSEIFRMKRIKKKYLAITQGVPSEMEGKIDIVINKEEDEDGFEKVRKSAAGKRALTYYKVLDRAASLYAVLELDIVTGRTHQIRVHLSEIGCPVIGDDKYGARSALAESFGKHLFLHAYQISFELLGKKYDFEAELPDYFYKALNYFELSVKK